MDFHEIETKIKNASAAVYEHFNDKQKREHLKKLLLRCKDQNAVPIINYNDAVSCEENRKMEISDLKKCGGAVECVDNDETASQIACLLKSKILLILTSVDGIYKNPQDASTLITEIGGKDVSEVVANMEEYKKYCVGASRKGANGAIAKLEYTKDAVKNGTTVYIANAKHSIKDILKNKVVCTKIGVR